MSSEEKPKDSRPTFTEIKLDELKDGQLISNVREFVLDNKEKIQVVMVAGFLTQETDKAKLTYRRGQTAGLGATPIVNTSVANDTTDFFSTAITAKNSPSRFNIFVGLNTSAVLNARITNGSTTVTIAFNSGLPLNANAGYTLALLVNKDDTLNFRHDAAGGATVLYMVVSEVPDSK